MPIVRIADQPEAAWRPGQTLRQVIGSAQGSSSLSMQHFTVEPGAETPLHWHDVDEALLPLCGAFTCTSTISGAPRGPATCAYSPRAARTASPAPATVRQ